jgi:hypothetical protein
MVFAAANGNAYVYLIGATPVFASIVYLMIVVAYGMNRKVIAESKAFDLGRWAKPLIGISLIWEVYLILDFTLPSIFHKAAEVAIGGEIVATLWYFIGLRGRLRRGEAGQALSLGKLAGADTLTAPAGAAQATAVQPEADLGG